MRMRANKRRMWHGKRRLGAKMLVRGSRLLSQVARHFKIINDIFLA